MIEKRKGFKFPIADGFEKIVIFAGPEFFIYEQYGTWFLFDRKEYDDRKP